MSIVYSSIVLLGFLMIACVTNTYDNNASTKIVYVNVYRGKTVFTSDGINSFSLKNLIGEKSRPNVLEIVFSEKMTNNRIMQIKEEVNTLNIPMVSFSESAFGLRSDAHNGKQVTRSELLQTIKNRGY